MDEPLPEAEPAPEVAAGGIARSVLLALAIGFSVAVATIGVAYAIIAIPFYVLAQSEPDHGLDRPFIRHGLFQVALPVALLLGAGVGALVGVWYARGGRLPTDRTPE
jgi:hypothetical protein